MQRIEIDNFGPITHAEIDIAKIVVLIGEQASGKSTTAKLIYFFKSLKEDFFSFIYQEQKYSTHYLHFFSSKIRNKFILFFPFITEKSDFSITFFYSKENSIRFIKKQEDYGIAIEYTGLSTKDNENILKEIIQKLHPKKTGHSIYEIKTQQTEEEAGTKLLLKYINNFFKDKLTSLYIPAGRNVSVTYSEQFKLLFFTELSKKFDKLLSGKTEETYSNNFSAEMFLMKEFIEEVVGISDYFKNTNFKGLIEKKKISEIKLDVNLLLYINDIIENILKGKYVQDASGEKLVFSEDNSSYIHLHNASSGQQEVIRILQDLFIVMLDKKNVFRVIEEPEAHLYPVAQKNLIELMATVVNSSESQIIITTHSPYILSVFNNLLYATKVAKLNKSKQKEVNEIIPEFAQLNPNEFRAYSLKNKSKTYIDDDLRYCEPIFDKETGMIAQNYLDDVSEELGDDFDRLYNIRTQL